MEHQAFLNTVLHFYPVYLRKALLKDIVDEGLAINNKKNDPNQMNLNLTDTLDVTDDETLDAKIQHVLQSDEICAYIEDFEYRKTYKHFCYFKTSGFNVATVKELVNSGKLNVFDRKNSSPIDSFDKPTIYSTNDTIYLKFSYRLQNYDGVVIKYVILVILDINNELIEIRFDKVGLAYKDTATFYKDKINHIIKYLEKNLSLTITTIDFKAVVEYMIREEKEITVVAQHMTRNGTTAYLEADEEDSTIPILGELDRFIEQHEELFKKNADTIEIEKLLREFRNDIDIKSDLPKVVIRFDELENVKVGITHNYKGTDFSLFMLYGDLLREKEVMGNVRDFLMQCHRELNNVAPPLILPSE